MIAYVFLIRMDVEEVASFVTSLYLYGRVSNKRPDRKQGPLKT
jgi:hypothetical protein